MLIWADMIVEDESLLAALPPGVTLCEWGYEAAHRFEERLARIAAAGVPAWVAPGTSSWLAILGRLSNAVDNCRNAATAALQHGAVGFLVTDWGDQGHLQQAPISEPPLAYAAAVAWCLDANRDMDLAAALSEHCFDDPTGELAAALVEAGDAHLAVTPQTANMSVLVRHLYYPQFALGRGATEGLTPSEVGEVSGRLERARGRLDHAKPQRADAAQVIEEVRWSIDLVALLMDDAQARLAGDGTLAGVSPATRIALADRLGALTEQYRGLWEARNRPGGLEQSVRWLDHLRSAYATGPPNPTWGGLTAKPGL
jgi:hypothetical protein